MTLEQIQIIHEELKKSLQGTSNRNLGMISTYAESLLEKINYMETMIRIRNTRAAEFEKQNEFKELNGP